MGRLSVPLLYKQTYQCELEKLQQDGCAIQFPFVRNNIYEAEFLYEGEEIKVRANQKYVFDSVFLEDNKLEEKQKILNLKKIFD